MPACEFSPAITALDGGAGTQNDWSPPFCRVRGGRRSAPEKDRHGLVELEVLRVDPTGGKGAPNDVQSRSTGSPQPPGTCPLTRQSGPPLGADREHAEAQRADGCLRGGGRAGETFRFTPGCQWSLVPLRNGEMHSTCLRPPLVSCGRKMPCMRRAVVLPLLLRLLPARPVLPQRSVVRRRRVNPRRVVRGWEVSSDQGRRIGVVYDLRVAVY